jgi:glycosyltransferase involved in cell wall biosynthesis
MKKSLISICIANYNKWKYIENCLESIKKYENNNIEIIIVDDCSTDDSIEIINIWIKNNPEIKVIFSQNIQNSWPWITYNNAIKKASWEYITFMDSDDFFVASTLENKRNLLKENQNLKIIYWNWTFFENNILNWNIHKNSISLFKKLEFSPEKILNNIYCKVPLLSVSSCLIRKDFLIKIWWFDEKCFSNDWILNIKIFQNLKSREEFNIDETITFWYRIHENNISKDYEKILKMLIQVIDKYCPNDLKKIWYSNIYFTNSLSNLTIGKYKQSFISIGKSLSYKSDIKKSLLFIISFFWSFVIKFIPKNILNKTKSIILKYIQ